jgi:hypothetical protein
MTRGKLRAALLASLLAASSAACIGPRAPRTYVPYAVRLLGADDGALRGKISGDRSVFVGDRGRDYAIEVTNETRSDVGLSFVIDGLDATTGAPVTSCERLGGWIVPAEGTTVARGFAVSTTRTASYRFAPRERSLAAITRGGRREAIGTIEVCFFSLRPTTRTATERPPVPFGGIVESEAAPAPVVAELRDHPASGSAELEDDKLLSRIVVAYEDENGTALGTAPPPAGIARVAVPVGPPPHDDHENEAEPPKGTKPQKPPKPSKYPPRPGKPTKPDKDKGEK